MSDAKPQARAIDLFCGAGGLTEGLRLARFRVIAAVDSDPLAVKTYQLNHKRTRVWEADILDLEPETVMSELELKRGELDLLAGCPPCQGFSTMRTHNGSRAVDDPNNDLVFAFVSWVKALRPKALMLENVPALKNDVRMERVRRSLRGAGYHLVESVLDAAAYGVAQRRRRFILLGLRGRRPRLGTPARRRRSVRAAIGRLSPAGESGDPLHDLGEKRSAHIAQLIADIPQDGGSRSDLGPERQLACHERSDGWKDVYGRLAWAGVSSTITGGFVNPSKGRFLHPEESRALTLREGACLQSFRPSYRFSLERGKFPAAQLIGNALPPRFIARHATAVREDLELEREPAA